MALKFDETIKAGDVLTSITVLLAVLTLVSSLSKDRATRAAEQANKVRAAAATTLVKLDRWQAIQLSLYQELQPNFVELSEDLSKQYDVIIVRDRFWKIFGVAQARISKQILDEQLNTGYAEIVTHFPAVRSRVVAVFALLANVEARTSNEFLEMSQQQILSLRGKDESYQTRDLGNALRESAGKSAIQLVRNSELILEPLRKCLFQLIAKPDDEIVNASRSLDRLQCDPDRRPVLKLVP